MQGPTPADAPDSPRYRGFVLVMLLLVYAFNFVDRQIIGILAIPIKAELGLTDTQLALMGGLAFALFYSVLAIPVAWAADRYSRSWIITISLALWSGFTALCGLATGFWQLFLARLGVGIGEAGGVAPSYALIADYFPPGTRARAISVYSLGIPIGSAAGILLGGWIASTVDWRWAFIVVGLAGVVLAPVFRLTVREPRRGRLDPPRPAAPPPPLGLVMRTLAARPSFWLLGFGAASCSTMGYGLAFWLPSYFKRTLGLGLLETSQFYGALTLIGGLAGIAASGWIADRLGRRSRRAYPLVPAVAFLVTVPLYAVGLTATSPALAFACFLLPTALALTWLAPVLTAVQHLVPASMRATASASFLLINNLIGLGAGTLFLGRISDALAARHGDQSLGYAILYGLGFYLLSAFLFFLASRRLERDWVD